MTAVGDIFNFGYTGDIQEFVVPKSGIWKLEVWGAQGQFSYTSTSTYQGGYGGYATGSCWLNSGQKLFIVVGGQGTRGNGTNVSYAGGYNGGGIGTTAYDKSYGYASGGGGATHIATLSGLLRSLENNKDKILIVAGGGAGHWYISSVYCTITPGHGGGYIGGSGLGIADPRYRNNSGGNQEFGAAFGTGNTQSIRESPGSGGGFYGGDSNSWDAHAAGGGSGYIGNHLLFDKHMAGYNVPTSNERDTKTISTTLYSSTAISDYAKSGPGYAKITYLGVNNKNKIFFPRRNRNNGIITPNKTSLIFQSSRKNVIRNARYYVFPDSVPRLIAQYMFNNNCNDETGNYNAIAVRSLSYENIPTGLNFGGKVAVFNGSTAQVVLPAICSITGTKPKSVEVWAYVNSTQSTAYITSVWRTFFSFGVTGANKSSSFFFKTDTKQLVYNTLDNDVYFGNYAADSWHHIVFTYPGSVDSAAYKCYYDGVEQTQTLINGNPIASGCPSNFSIGYRQATASNFLTGKLANLRIYNYELSATDILSHYQKESRA